MVTGPVYQKYCENWDKRLVLAGEGAAPSGSAADDAALFELGWGVYLAARLQLSYSDMKPCFMCMLCAVEFVVKHAVAKPAPPRPRRRTTVGVVFLCPRAANRPRAHHSPDTPQSLEMDVASLLTGLSQNSQGTGEAMSAGPDAAAALAVDAAAQSAAAADTDDSDGDSDDDMRRSPVLAAVCRLNMVEDFSELKRCALLLLLLRANERT